LNQTTKTRSLLKRTRNAEVSIPLQSSDKLRKLVETEGKTKFKNMKLQKKIKREKEPKSIKSKEKTD
jgi:hypothetical protein